MRIRPADPDSSGDGAGCAALYAPFVEHTGVSFETTPPNADEFARRIDRLSASHAFLVAEDEHGLAGFAYGAPHRLRDAYRWSTEVSVYIHARAQRQGVGRGLYGRLLPRLAERGMFTPLAGVALPNPASIALHESVGFRPVGVYHRIGFKLGRWFDVAWFELPLREGRPEADAQPPLL